MEQESCSSTSNQLHLTSTLHSLPSLLSVSFGKEQPKRCSILFHKINLNYELYQVKTIVAVIVDVNFTEALCKFRVNSVLILCKLSPPFSNQC